MEKGDEIADGQRDKFEERFRALLVEDDPAVHAAGDLERDPAGHVALDQAGDHVRLRTLGREDEMHADGSRLLGDADDRMLDLLVGHHQVGEFVDDLRHGTGKLYDASGALIRAGEWKKEFEARLEQRAKAPWSTMRAIYRLMFYKEPFVEE